MDDYKEAKLYDKILFPFLYPIRRRILKIVKTNEYKSILDVCCGTGNQLKILQKNKIAGEGIDLSKEMLSVALNGKNPVKCKLEDATEISHSDESFDMVMTTFALHEKEPDVAKKIIQEMIRLTKDGGDIIITDFNISSEASKFAARIIDRIESNAGKEHYANFCKYRDFGGLDYLLKGHSFKNVERQTIFFKGVSIIILKK